MKKVVVLSSYEFLKKFNTEFKCLKFLERNIWKNGIKCGFCGSDEVSKKNKKTGFHYCNDCKKQFNVRTNTIFHRSRIPLQKWLYASYLLQTSRKGVSSLQLSKQLGITQKSAWFMLHRLREASKSGSFKLSGDVKSDETYFGGKNKNRHKNKRKKNWQADKIMVQGIKAENQLKFHIINSPNKKDLTRQYS
ncbi:MAG: IS1595 family transposase [Oligoflexia bacterium]|nr:IS1595 family transposase [Oligoflexia bacterium]